MRGGTFSVLLVVFAVVQLPASLARPGTEEGHEHDADFDNIDHRLDRLTTKLGKLLEAIDRRTDPKRIAKAHSLEQRVTRIKGDGCGKREFQCGGDDPECIGDLFVCDGNKDCRNGADEERCELPFKVGDIYDGHVLTDTCTQRRPEIISFEVKTIRQQPFFPGFPGIKVNVLIDHESESEGLHGSVALPSVGLYRFATQKLVLEPPEADRLALVCQFDGYNMEKCYGKIKREATRDVCATLVFIKRH